MGCNKSTGNNVEADATNDVGFPQDDRRRRDRGRARPVAVSVSFTVYRVPSTVVGRHETWFIIKQINAVMVKKNGIREGVRGNLVIFCTICFK